MTAHTSTHDPVRSDVPLPQPPCTPGRGWALAGVVAGLAGMATVVSTSMVDAPYDPALTGDTAGIVAKLATQTGPILAFHLAAVIGALTMVVFAAGLQRRLRAQMPDSIVPAVAAAGLLGTAVVSVLGSGLDTEYYWGLTGGFVDGDPNAVFFAHWIGTIPWIWVLAGLSGLALFVAGRAGALPRWIGVVGLVLGGLTTLVGISPMQYLAGFTGPVWLLVTALGLLLGDRAYRVTR